MPNYMEEAFASSEARDRDRVASATWGHLAPELGKTYYGKVVFAHSAYGGDAAFLSIQFALPDGTALCDNPWSFDDLTNYIVQWICDQANGYRNHTKISDADRIDPEGKVFRFKGSYRRFKNNACRIHGTFEELIIG